MNKPSEKLLKRVRDYAVDEPGFTCAFAAWDLTTNHNYKVGAAAVKGAVAVLLDMGVVEKVEDAGRFGKVYAYVPPLATITRIEPRVSLPELDAAIGVGAQSPRRGSEVPHTGGAVGPSGRPGRDRKKQEAGFRVKRQRQGT